VGGEAEIYSAAGTLWKQIQVREVVERQGHSVHYSGRYSLGGPLDERERIVNSRARVEQKLVVKVFKEGFLLPDLLKNWSPRWMTESYPGRSNGNNGCNKSGGSSNLCWAVGAQLLNDSKFQGRFALLLPRYDCDLRKLIDQRKMRCQANEPPFKRGHTYRIVFKLAKAMAELHELGLLHRDLKAANVLCNCKDGLVDELSIADFESSVGVIGTRFWRAPEILKAVKTRILHPRSCHPCSRCL
jgi:serine/threonine protein kinase